jgi:hypothetical protein
MLLMQDCVGCYTSAPLHLLKLNQLDANGTGKKDQVGSVACKMSCLADIFVKTYTMNLYMVVNAWSDKRVST